MQLVLQMKLHVFLELVMRRNWSCGGREIDINDEHFITYVDDTSDEDPSEDDSLMGDDTDMCAFHDVLASALVG